VLVVLVPRGVHHYSSGTAHRVDFGLVMVDALDNDDLVHEASAIVSRQSPSALAHAAD
jgi:hypothetical protein